MFIGQVSTGVISGCARQWTSYIGYLTGQTFSTLSSTLTPNYRPFSRMVGLRRSGHILELLLNIANKWSRHARVSIPLATGRLLFHTYARSLTCSQRRPPLRSLSRNYRPQRHRCLRYESGWRRSSHTFIATLLLPGHPLCAPCPWSIRLSTNSIPRLRTFCSSSHALNCSTLHLSSFLQRCCIISPPSKTYITA